MLRVSQCPEGNGCQPCGALHYSAKLHVITVIVEVVRPHMNGEKKSHIICPGAYGPKWGLRSNPQA